MKKYVIALIGFILALISINTVYAATPTGWGYNITRPTQAWIYDCNSSKCDANLNAEVDQVDASTFYYSASDSTSMSANGPGNMWIYLLDSLISKDYLYSITSYVCSTNYSANLVLKDYYSSNALANVYNKVDKGTSYYSQTLSNLNPTPYNAPSGTFGSCSYFTSIYKPSVNSKYIGVNFSVDMQRNNFVSTFVGYKVSSLGLANNLSTSDIQNIIGSSGLASSSDINSLNTSITNIQNQLANNISSAENSINNNIDDAETNIIDNVNDGLKGVNDNLREESQNIQNGIKDGFEECRDSYNLFDGQIEVGSINPNDGTLVDNVYRSRSVNYVKVSPNTTYYFKSNFGEYTWIIGYNSNKIGITDGNYQNHPSSIIARNIGDFTFTTTPTTEYIKWYYTGSNSTSSKVMLSLHDVPFEEYNQKVCKNRIDSTNEKLDDLNGTLNNSDSSGATDDAGSFFSGFTTNTFGLTSIITSPLNLINSLTSKTCSPLRLQIPFVNQNLDLPCMTTIYQQHFGTFLTIYQTITFGIISYWICIRIFALVKDFKNPDHDEIEVMDL